MSEGVQIRPLAEPDCERISAAFAAQGWDKPAALYRRYLKEQDDGIRAVFVAELSGDFAGYGTLVWVSSYPLFRAREIPEIVDLNVLKLYQRRGIGGALLAAAEKLAARRSTLVGIGVGLSADYGPAQRLYVKRGYIPDGHGAFQGGRFIAQGERVRVDDDLGLYLLKELGASGADEGGAATTAENDAQFQKTLTEMQEILENL